MEKLSISESKIRENWSFFYLLQFWNIFLKQVKNIDKFFIENNLKMIIMENGKWGNCSNLCCNNNFLSQ